MAKKLTKDASAADHQTVLWGVKNEARDFIKVPRAVLLLGRYAPELMAKLQPRHLWLLLALAARKYKKKEIRAHWAKLAEDLGTRPDTVRKWGYELQRKGLLRIIRHRRRDPAFHKRYGQRNDSNGFDITPFVDALSGAFGSRKHDLRRKHRRDPANGEEP